MQLPVLVELVVYPGEQLVADFGAAGIRQFFSAAPEIDVDLLDPGQAGAGIRLPAAISREPVMAVEVKDIGGVIAVVELFAAGERHLGVIGTVFPAEFQRNLVAEAITDPEAAGEPGVEIDVGVTGAALDILEIAVDVGHLAQSHVGPDEPVVVGQRRRATAGQQSG